MVAVVAVIEGKEQRPMKAMIAGVTLALALFASFEVPLGVSLVTQAQAQSGNDALWRQCRKAVFKKYGHRRPDKPGKVYLSSRDAIRYTDACVANGGRVP
jgi:hypothetical protein